MTNKASISPLPPSRRGKLWFQPGKRTKPAKTKPESSSKLFIRSQLRCPEGWTPDTNVPDVIDRPGLRGHEFRAFGPPAAAVVLLTVTVAVPLLALLKSTV